jgi:hypothetical protein
VPRQHPGPYREVFFFFIEVHGAKLKFISQKYFKNNFSNNFGKLVLK